MLRHVGGIDHCVVLVRDLDAARDTYARLGFTVAPRGLHSAHMGTGNHCIMLGGDYVELLGVLAPTEANAKWRAVLAEREGMTAVALRAADADQGAAEIAARGVPVLPVMHFGRPVDLPDGTRTEARFHTFHLKDPPAPGLRLFACQHLVPEATWAPGLMDHANTAQGLAAIEVLAEHPAAAAEAVGRVLDRVPETVAPGVVRLPTGAAPLLFLTRAALAARYPGLHLDGLPEAGPVGLALRVADIVAARRCLAAAHVPLEEGPHGLSVPPAAAHGVVLSFHTAQDQPA